MRIPGRGKSFSQRSLKAIDLSPSGGKSFSTAPHTSIAAPFFFSQSLRQPGKSWDRRQLQGNNAERARKRLARTSALAWLDSISPRGREFALKQSNLTP
jgi:hypothetical protein